MRLFLEALIQFVVGLSGAFAVAVLIHECRRIPEIIKKLRADPPPDESARNE